MKNDDVLITYSAIAEQIRRARLQRSVYLAEAIANGITAMTRAATNLFGRLGSAPAPAPRLRTERKLATR